MEAPIYSLLVRSTGCLDLLMASELGGEGGGWGAVVLDLTLNLWNLTISLGVGSVRIELL